MFSHLKRMTSDQEDITYCSASHPIVTLLHQILLQQWFLQSMSFCLENHKMNILQITWHPTKLILFFTHEKNDKKMQRILYLSTSCSFITLNQCFFDKLLLRKQFLQSKVFGLGIFNTSKAVNRGLISTTQHLTKIHDLYFVCWSNTSNFTTHHNFVCNDFVLCFIHCFELLTGFPASTCATFALFVFRLSGSYFNSFVVWSFKWSTLACAA